MDYEVFLVSRIREEYLESRDNAVAVARGLAATASVITAAAAIMFVGFLGFVLNDQRVVKAGSDWRSPCWLMQRSSGRC